MAFRSIARTVLAAVAAGTLLPAVPAAAGDGAFAEPRRQMVEQIERIARAGDPVAGRQTLAPAVLEVMGRVPRHLFVPEDISGDAYADRPLPIGFGQTISQPYIVALMTDLVDPDPGYTVLEVGTGSGYQAAVLAELVGRVVTVEIIPELAAQARARLRLLGYDNVVVHAADGYYGREDEAPFDAIVVTAAASHVPPPLVRQLKPGGRMIIPVGNWFFVQHLVLVEKDADGAVRTRQVLPVRFVPLTGGH